MSARKQVDVLATVTENARSYRIALEVNRTTVATEPAQALTNLQQGADYTVIVCPTSATLKETVRQLHGELGAAIDPRITLCLPWHLRSYDLLTICRYGKLVFDSKRVQPSKGTQT